LGKTKVEKIPREYYDYFDDLYRRLDPVKAAIDIVVEKTVGGGFTIEAQKGADKEKSKQIIKILEEFTEEVKLPRLMFDMTTDMLVFGNSFTEKVKKGSNPIAELIRHDPRTIAVMTNEKGELQGYAKIEDGNIVKRFSKDDIMHMKNPNTPPLGKGWYGRSQIEVLLPKIKEKFKLKDVPSI